MSLQRIVVGVDGSEGSAEAMRWCAGLAKALNAEVVVVFGFEPPVYMSGLRASLVPGEVLQGAIDHVRAATREALDGEWCDPLREAGVSFRTRFSEGHASRAIIEAAEEADAGLVVVGSRGLGGFTGLMLGSVSSHVVHHSARPVVVVPHSAR